MRRGTKVRLKVDTSMDLYHKGDVLKCIWVELDKQHFFAQKGSKAVCLNTVKYKVLKKKMKSRKEIKKLLKQKPIPANRRYEGDKPLNDAWLNGYDKALKWVLNK